MKPTTKYTKSGSINIAYQVFGSGSVDLVYIPGWISNIDLMWECPELVYFFKELSKLCRIILFDKRGTGLSDRIVELSSLEERMDDIRAVMDAVSSQKSVLFGHSEGGSVSALFAATYPNRTLALVTFGIFAKRRFSKTYPWAPTDSERQKVYDMIEHNWGGGNMNLESLAPSRASDPVFMDWLARYFRSGASPSAALVLTKMNTQVDIINILSSIKVPTLIMQRTGDVDVKIEEGKFIANRIKSSQFIELPGNDHLFWVGNTLTVIDAIKSFLVNLEFDKQYNDQLYTILALRLDDKSTFQPNNEEFLAVIKQYNGRIVTEINELIVSFEGPSKAVNCGIDLINYFKNQNQRVNGAIHIKEAPANESHFVSKNTHSFMNDMLKQANSFELLITQTVKHLLSGTGYIFKTAKTKYSFNTNEPHILFSVTDELDALPYITVPPIALSNTHNSFLEKILQIIDTNIANEDFNIKVICENMYISERQLQRKLKAITNKSPNNLITSVRLHRAKELLMEKELSVSEIAYKTGFSNPSYFSKSFKKEFGLSPTSLIESV